MEDRCIELQIIMCTGKNSCTYYPWFHMSYTFDPQNILWQPSHEKLYQILVWTLRLRKQKPGTKIQLKTNTTLDWLCPGFVHISLMHTNSQNRKLLRCYSSLHWSPSRLSPLLFSIYTSPVAHIASDYDVPQQQYAHDTQLYVAISTASSSSTVNNHHHHFICQI